MNTTYFFSATIADIFLTIQSPFLPEANIRLETPTVL